MEGKKQIREVCCFDVVLTGGEGPEGNCNIES